MKINNELLLYEKLIDSRDIYFSLDFAHITKEMMSRINKLILKTLLPLFLEECVIELYIDNAVIGEDGKKRKIREKNIPKMLSELDSDSYEPILSMTADIAPRNEVMTSGSAFRNIVEHGDGPAFPYYDLERGMASGYMDYCQEEFVKYDLKEAVRRLLYEDEIYYWMPYVSWFGLHSFCHDYYYGSADHYAECRFNIGANDIAEGANELIAILEKLMDDIIEIHAWTSGAIACSSTHYSHSYCFFYNERIMKEKGYANVNRSRRRIADTYLYGAEWLTLISPQVMKRLDKENLKASDKITYHEYGSGAVKVKMKKHLYDVKVQDMYDMKRLLEPALIPGMQDFPMEPDLGYHEELGYNNMYMTLRDRWQFAPLNPEEISTKPKGNVSYTVLSKNYGPLRQITVVHKPELCLNDRELDIFYKHQWKSWN